MTATKRPEISKRSATASKAGAGKPARVRADWEAIEREYRAGIRSIREIAKVHDISDKAIRNKAKEHGWQRDLTEKVNEQVRTALVRAESALEAAKTEQEIVDDAANQVVAVVRSHRKRIGHTTELVDLLTKQLIDVAGTREDFEEAIEIECADDESPKRRTLLMKAVSLPTHSTVAVNLANALKTLVGLERQAFNIKDDTAPPADVLSELLKQVSGSALKPVADHDADSDA